jgi:hypothetical protein
LSSPVRKFENDQLTAMNKTHTQTSMFKRNQVEQAISGLLELSLSEPTLSLKTRIKRLLDTDRSLPINTRAHDPEERNYAFFRQASPGSGVEVWYSAYESFALLMGLQLMAHSWPQRFVVSIMRRIRVPLESEHARILGLDPKMLFDPKAIKKNTVPGLVAYPTATPAFLVTASNPQIKREGVAPFSCSVHRDVNSAAVWIEQMTSWFGGGSTMFELTTVAHRLAKALSVTQPQSRGPAG